MRSGRKRVAVIGAGVAGISASHYLQRKFDVELLEKSDRLGGHTNTRELKEDAGSVFVDTGFIVFNERNYPEFCRFLRELKVDSQDSDMSFSFSSNEADFEYAGTNLNGIFANRTNIYSLRFWKFLGEIARFAVAGQKQLKTHDLRLSLEEFLKQNAFSDDFRRRYLLAMGAAIWSTPEHKMLEYPADPFLRFLDNHGLIKLIDRPKWKTVTNGSHQYIKAFLKGFSGKVHLKQRIANVERLNESVRISFEDSEARDYDKVIFAVHADQVLSLLKDPSSAEKEAFGCWRYNLNPTILHSDKSLLPRRRRAWASWNYKETDRDTMLLSYHMNRLQSLRTKKNYIVSLNADNRIPEGQIHYRTVYEHPIYTAQSPRSQESIKSLNGLNSTYFCGSYLGNGFHEDAVRSSVELAKQLGVFHGS